MQPINLPVLLGFLRKLPLPHKLGLLERIYGRSLASHGINWVVTSNDVDWKLDLTDPCHRWIVYGDYEGSVGMNWIREWMSNGGVFIDSGANIGQILLYVAPINNVTAFAFEPLKKNFQWLKECLSMHKDWNVQLIQKGLSDKDDTAEIQVDGPRSTLRMDWYSSKNLDHDTINLTLLDQSMEQNNVDRIRLWKLDVEGHELEALKGAKELLGDKSIDAIYLELTGGNYESVNAYLDEVGYKLFQLSIDGSLIKMHSDPAITANLIALPQ